MSTLQRRRMMMAQGVIYDGTPLMITNVGDEPIEVSLRFNALRKTAPPVIYYNTNGKKTYKKWDLSNITLAKGGTLHLFGKNSVVDSTFVVNGNSSIHLDGKLEALLQGQVGTKQFGNYALEGLFKDVTQLESVGDIMPQVIGGVNAPSGYSEGYRYLSLFENTGIVEIPNNFLKETSIGSPCLGIYKRMFFGCQKLTTIPRDLFINQSGGSANYMYQSMFQNCSNLEVAADVYCQSQSFMTTHSMYRGCKKITDVKVFTKTLASNHSMQYFVADCDNLQSIDFDINRVTHWGVLSNAMLNCKSLTKVSIKVKTWDHEQTITTHGTYSDWMSGVSPTGTFTCPKELAEATDGYYDEEGNFVAGIGRGYSSVPAGWIIDFPIIDARDGDANDMALMAVISQQTHADGTPWVKDSLVMMKSEAEKVEDIGTVFKGKLSEAGNRNRDFSAFKYFTNPNFTKIPDSAFESCYGLKKIILPSQITSIGNRAFYYITLSDIEIPDSVATIGSSCFAICTSLLSIRLPKFLTLLPYGIFERCTNLQHLDISNITTIQGEALSNNKFTTFHIPKGVETLSRGFLGSQENLTSITIEEGTSKYIIENNCVIDKTTNVLLASTNDSSIPDWVTGLGNYAFNKRKFSSKKLVIPSSVEIIYNYCIANTDLEVIELPETSIQLQNAAIWSNNSLKTLICRCTTPHANIENNTNANLESIYVPDDSVEAYKTSWSIYADIIKPLTEYTPS